MRKEDILVLTQLLNGIKDAILKLEISERKKDFSSIVEAKREILNFQKEIDEML